MTSPVHGTPLACALRRLLRRHGADGHGRCVTGPPTTKKFSYRTTVGSYVNPCLFCAKSPVPRFGDALLAAAPARGVSLQWAGGAAGLAEGWPRRLILCLRQQHGLFSPRRPTRLEATRATAARSRERLQARLHAAWFCAARACIRVARRGRWRRVPRRPLHTLAARLAQALCE